MFDYRKYDNTPLNDDLQEAFDTQDLSTDDREFVGFMLRWRERNKMQSPRILPTGGTSIKLNESAHLMLMAYNNGNKANERTEQSVKAGFETIDAIDEQALALAARKRPAAAKLEPETLRS